MLSHYLAGSAGDGADGTVTPDSWNRQIDAFDVDGLAAQLASAKVPYFCLTMGQTSGVMRAPNATYDRLVNRRPSRLSRRDLIADLADALAPHGIRMMACGMARTLA